MGRPVVAALLLLFSVGACADPVDPDGGPRDAEITDRGASDTSVAQDASTDAGPSDAAPDSGETDAALADATPSDAAPSDASSDAGPFVVAFSPRLGHAQSLLPDGRVLITGGNGGANTEQQSFLFDPATRMLTEGATISPPRSGHTSTLLPTGEVVLVGGRAGNGAQATHTDRALLFDPSSGTFRETGRLASPRYAHEAILLGAGPNAGKLLIAGGADGLVRILGLEIYDPATGMFSSVGVSLPEQRDGASYTTLADGSILIVGGAATPGSFDVRASAYRYDPVGNTLDELPNPMARARMEHTAHRMSDGRVLIIGGRDRGPNFDDAEIFDPISGLFTPGPMPTSARSSAPAVALSDGRLLRIGGATGGGASDTVEVFEESGGFSLHVRTLSMPLASARPTLLPGGAVLLTGGQGMGGIVVGQIELFIP